MAKCIRCGRYAPQRFCSRECSTARNCEMMRYRLEGHTFKEVGQKFGISAARANEAVGQAARWTLYRLQKIRISESL